ncbi:GNAT family N-acetyltransferase [Rhizobium sp. CBN3]|uniref:GNAT family N-acetyltransferase n=1 Tax=Rhizobium sp. CBN3 TaxID=3058045 RepID=UPI002673D2AA|nr:GNAT family N-acetyltransferase [Rhizobium sp. CBN3]MDO3432109.1 GNAT family N-acetyltransferase [Rhizobium sp. CBN3]
MRELKLDPIDVCDELKAALAGAALPTDDIDEPGRSYFRLADLEGRVIGYSGIETASDDAVLLRSMVILPSFRSEGHGRRLAEMTLERTPRAAEVYLATTNAAPFFEHLGFVAVGRDQVPRAILSTRQLSGLCPASATIMRLTRPPT